MIIVRLSGGLGNQLFQYALGRRLVQDRNTVLKLDLSWFHKQTLRTYQLGAFNISADIASPKEIEAMTHPRHSGWIRRIEQGIQRRTPYYRRRVIREKSLSFDPLIVHSVPQDAYLIGYWQSEKYFDSIEFLLRQELTCQSPPDKLNEDLLQLISDTNSVSLHIRRGDYVSNPVANQILGLCSREYYQKCIQLLESEVSNPYFFVFSDDREWAKLNLSTNYPVMFVEHNPADKDYEDFRLMKACKYHIIANSSFSWWAAWLSSHPQKKAWSPRQWFNDKSISSQDLIPASWIRV